MIDTLAQRHLGKTKKNIFVLNSLAQVFAHQGLIFQDMIKLFKDTLLKEFQNIAISTQDISAKLEFFSFFLHKTK